MDVIGYLQTLLGERYGKVLSACKGGSWLYTPQGKTKICIPRFVAKGEGETLPGDLSYELLDEEVLFIETDKGIITKDGNLYRFYPKGSYRLEWKK